MHLCICSLQVVIMLSTGTPTWTQGISLVSSVLSLSWGASRTFMMLRPSDKADADPELITVSLRIWPYVLEQFRSKSNNMRNLDVSYVRLLSYWTDSCFSIVSWQTPVRIVIEHRREIFWTFMSLKSIFFADKDTLFSYVPRRPHFSTPSVSQLMLV